LAGDVGVEGTIVDGHAVITGKVLPDRGIDAAAAA
jgi:hypothetical protein